MHIQMTHLLVRQSVAPGSFWARHGTVSQLYPHSGIMLCYWRLQLDEIGTRSRTIKETRGQLSLTWIITRWMDSDLDVMVLSYAW